MSVADVLRKEADELTAQAQVYLKSLDPEKPSDANLLGMIATVKAAVFHASADLHDKIEQIQLDPAGKHASRMHRMRMAALRNDNAAIKAIEQEIIDEHERKHGGTAETDSGAA